MPKNNASEMRIQELKAECAKLRQWLEEAKRDAQAARRRRHEDLALFCASVNAKMANSLDPKNFSDPVLLEAIMAVHRKEKLTGPQKEAIKTWRREWRLDGDGTLLECLAASLKRQAEVRRCWLEAERLIGRACDA